MTNGDKIRQMTDDDLTDILTNFWVATCHGEVRPNCAQFHSCHDCCFDWLQQEVDENG